MPPHSGESDSSDEMILASAGGSLVDVSTDASDTGSQDNSTLVELDCVTGIVVPGPGPPLGPMGTRSELGLRRGRRVKRRREKSIAPERVTEPQISQNLVLKPLEQLPCSEPVPMKMVEQRGHSSPVVSLPGGSLGWDVSCIVPPGSTLISVDLVEREVSLGHEQLEGLESSGLDTLDRHISSADGVVGSVSVLESEVDQVVRGGDQVVHGADQVVHGGDQVIREDRAVEVTSGEVLQEPSFHGFDHEETSDFSGFQQVQGPVLPEYLLNINIKLTGAERLPLQHLFS
ncbi:uncharacterized protein LOC125178676 [Hyalella azteca]|uniref:Uncharacterized protein LOC125178676 n=1 Tax=Hyalella azteca TaxID=294128 RepID=A0A979FPG0_HYAAZ|nr:uncharacterized protein LOC125178676 [Hyalella azteca]